MTAKVVVGGHESDPFMVNVGVKQGCVLAPVIFNLILVAVTLAFHSGILTEDNVGLNHRLDGSLFDIRRLQAKSKISSEYVFELQYADDAALPSHTADDGLQRNLNRICEAYRRAGPVVNVKKTDVLGFSVFTGGTRSLVPRCEAGPTLTVMQRQLRWIGHVIRMQSNRLPRHILYSGLQHDQRAPGGQKKRFSDHVKAIFKKCSVPPDQL